MAYYDYHDDGYMWPQEHTSYDLVPYEDSVSFSDYEPYSVDTRCDAYSVSDYHEHKFTHQYYDYGYGQNSYSSRNVEINYFAHNYEKPKLIMYELAVECETDYVSYHTQHSISYSKMDSGFNEPEFEEYDPTPYGGGYDIVLEYGKPLPPSDKTCYPRSKPEHKPINPVTNPEPKSKPEPRPEPEPKPEPKRKPEPEPKPDSHPESIATPIPVIEPKLEPKHEPKLSKPEPDHVLVNDPANEVIPVPEPFGLREEGNKQREEYGYPVYGYDYPWPEYDHGNGTGAGYDNGFGNHVVQSAPCEYNQEVVELCENIFGSWPCLDKIKKQQMGIHNKPGNTYPENGYHNPWEECVNYFFGSPIASYNQ